MTKRKYRAAWRRPRTMERALTLLIFVAGPVSMESCGAAQGEPSPQPFLEQGNRPAAADIEGNANGCCHKNARHLAAAKKAVQKGGRHITLEQGGNHKSHDKIGPCDLEVPSYVFQKSHGRPGVRIMVFRFQEVSKGEKGTRLLVEQEPRRNSADKAGEEAD